MNKRIEEKVKDDRMSNHATFIAAKRQEIASLTAQIETKLTRQGDPAVAAVEAESMKNEFKDAELSCAEAKEALASARDLEAEELPANHETTFLNGESVGIVGGRRAADNGLRQSACCGSRQAFVVVSIRTGTFRLAMRWCAY